ncbi:MAG: hypothetical protein IPM79_38410 [Polyangiaceae bacterium]|jgi:hypothetical protein|nr:hypothetical protein [Polyangiaceae bacterium]
MKKLVALLGLASILGCSRPREPASVSDDSGPRAPSGGSQGLQEGSSTPAVATATTTTTTTAAPPPAPPGKPGKGVIGPEGVLAFDALKPDDAKRLKTARIFFGHQSVGNNLIEAAKGLGYTFKYALRGADLAAMGLSEAPVADNRDPLRKVKSFAELLVKEKIGERADLAGFKLCYVDFEDQGKTGGLEKAYATRISELRLAYPQLKFFHVTPPLTTDNAGFNKQRLAFGDFLKKTYSEQDIVIDLAAVESQLPDGTPCTLGGHRSLCSQYASDNGHLKGDGATRGAKVLLYAFARALGAP